MQDNPTPMHQAVPCPCRSSAPCRPQPTILAGPDVHQCHGGLAQDHHARRRRRGLRLLLRHLRLKYEHRLEPLHVRVGAALHLLPQRAGLLFDKALVGIGVALGQLVQHLPQLVRLLAERLDIAQAGRQLAAGAKPAQASTARNVQQPLHEDLLGQKPHAAAVCSCYLLRLLLLGPPRPRRRGVEPPLLQVLQQLATVLLLLLVCLRKALRLLARHAVRVRVRTCTCTTMASAWIWVSVRSPPLPLPPARGSNPRSHVVKASVVHE